MDDFEAWTRSEISAAQAKIVEMERALALFLSWRARAANEATSPRKSIHREVLKPRRRVSRNEVIFDAFEAAGPKGLSQEDVQQIARDNGLNQNANALRALCWAAKKDGRLISIAPGRYATAANNEAAVNNSTKGEIVAPREDAAPRLPMSGDGDAASARSDHNQHREGDAGGGI